MSSTFGKKLGKGLLVVGGVLLVLVLLVGVLLHTPPVLERVGAFAEKAASNALEGTLEIEGMEGSPFGTLVAHEVVLRGPDGERVASVRSVEIEISFAALLARTISVDVHGEGLVGYLERREDGSLNIVELFGEEEPTSGPSPFAFDISVHVPDGVVVWRDASAPGVDDPLAELEADFEMQTLDDAVKLVPTPENMVRAMPHTAVLRDIALDLRVTVDRESRTNVGVSQLDARAIVPGVTGSRALSVRDLRLAILEDATKLSLAELQIADWLELTDARAQVSDANIENFGLHVQRLELTEAVARFAGADLQLRSGLALELHASGRADDATLLWAEIVPTSTKGRLVAAGRISNWMTPGPETTFDLALRADDLHAAQIVGIAEPLHQVNLAADIEGSGVDPQSMEVTGRLAVWNSDVSNYRISAAYLEGSVADGRYEIEKAIVTSPYASVGAHAVLEADGGFDIVARAVSTDVTAQVSRDLLGRELTARADIAIDADGELDLDASAPLDVMRRLDARARWDIEKFHMEDVRVDDSSGRLRLTVVPRTSGVRDVTWDVEASADGVVAAGNELTRARLDTAGSTRFEGSAIEARRVLGALDATIDADVEAASWDGGSIQGGHVLAKVSPSGGRLRYTVEASVDALDSGVRIDALATELAGEVKLGASLDWPQALAALSVRGDVAATGVDLGGGQDAGQILVKADVAGPIHDLGGTVDVNATDLAAGGFEFTTIAAQLQFTGERNFVIHAEGVQREEKPETIGLIVRGRYSRDLTDYTILDLQLRTVGDAWQMSGTLNADFDSGVFTFEDVVLSRGDQRVAIDGRFRQGRDQDLIADIERLNLAQLSEQFGLTALDPLQGTASGEITLRGTHERPTAEFRLELTGLMWNTLGPFDVLLAGSYDEEELRLDTIDATGYDSDLLDGTAVLPIDLDMSGDIELLRREQARAELTVPRLELASIAEHFVMFADIAVTGTAGAKLTLGGTFASPVVRFDADVEDAGTSGVLDGLEYEIGPADVQLLAVYLPIPANDAGFRARASVGFQEEPRMTVETMLHAPVADWVWAVIEGEEVDWTQKLEDAPFELTASAQRFDLRNLRFGALQAADVEGFVDLAIDASGTFEAPNVRFDVALDDFGWDRYRDVFVDLAGTVNQDRARVEKLALQWDGDDILRAQGTLPAPFALVFGDAKIEEIPLSFEVELLPLPLKKFSAIDYAFAALRGEISGFAKFGGTLQAPSLSGRISAVDVEFANRTRGTIAAQFGAQDDRVVADVLICEGVKPVLVGAVSAPVQLNVMKMIKADVYEPLLPGEVAATLKGNVELGGLIPRKALDDVVSGLAGTMAVDLALAGTVEDPVLSGTLDVRDGAVFLPLYSRAFRDIQVDLAMTKGGLLTIDRLHVGDVRGFADASGTIRFDGFQPTLIDARAALENFGTSGFTDLPAFVSAEIVASGDLSGAAANAKATISELEVVIPEASSSELHPTALDDDIVVVRPGRAVRDDLFASLESATPPSTETYARLQVVIERDSWIRHPFAEVEIQGDLRLELAGNGVTLGGDIQTVRGAAEVFGRRFVLQEGIVTFTGANPPNPMLQIEAVYEYDPNVAAALGPATEGDPHATVRVTGRVSDPEIRFYSDPDMPESDVIYTLLTNRAPGETDVGQGGAGNLAASAASGLAADFLQDQLQQILPVQFDLFRVEAGDSGFADPTVEVGKYLFEDVFFSVEYKIGADQNENTSEFNIEYRFSPRWLFEFEAGNRGTGEANVFWDIY